MEEKYIFETPFIKYQKVKGFYVVPLFIGGLLCMFLNFYIGTIVSFISLLLYFYYKNSSKNKSAMYFNYALKYYLVGKKQEAKGFLGKATMENRDNKHAFLFLGAIYYDEMDYRRALTNLKNGGMNSSSNINFKYILSDCYYNTEKYDKALNYIEDVQFDSNILENMRIYLLGKIYYNLGNYKKAFDNIIKYNLPEDITEKSKREYKYYYAISAINSGEEGKGLDILKELLNFDRYYRDIEYYGKKYNLI